MPPHPKPRQRGRPRYDDLADSTHEVFRLLAATRLNRDEVAPLWVQLKNRIQHAITTAQLLPHARVPSETALCDLFQVSNVVVRAALAALETEGFVVKMPRKGVFVAQPRQDVDFMTSNLSVYGDLSAKGHAVTSQTFEFYRSQADAREQQVFGLAANDVVVRIVRVYFCDDRPITHTHIALPAHKVPGLAKRDIDQRSIFQTIRARYGLSVQRAERWFTAELPDALTCSRMAVAPNTPLIAIESIAYDHHGGALEYYRAHYNCAVARIHLRIEGEAAS